MITIRISGEHAKAAADKLIKDTDLPLGKPEGQEGFVRMTEDGKAEILVGVHPKLFNSFVAPVIAPHIRLDNNPTGVLSPDSTWNAGTLELKAL